MLFRKLSSVSLRGIAIVLMVPWSVYCQSISLGARITPNVAPGASVVNPSPSNIYAQKDLGINLGVYALKYFAQKSLGLKVGVEYGSIPHNFGLDAPRNAFGLGGDEHTQINSIYSSNDYSYKAATLSLAYKAPIGNRYLELTAGPSFRYYGHYPGGFEEYMLAFNRAAPYDPEDPSNDPPDIRVRLANMNKIYLSVPVSIGYVFRLGVRSQIKTGIMYNISRPLNGNLEVIMYGEKYTGEFSPRTGFVGFNLQYERILKKSSNEYSLARSRTLTKTFRKAFLAQTFTRPGFVTINFDMRLTRDINSGIGVSAGLGLGEHYFTVVSNDNESTLLRSMALPLGLNYIFGSKRHGAEVGAAVIPQIRFHKLRPGAYDVNAAFFSGNIGYRFQPLKEGLLAKISWAPTLKNDAVFSKKELDISNAAFSLGFSFK